MRNNRNNDEKRNVQFILDINMHAEGSVLVHFGNTQVICTATIEDKPPVFLRGENKGWVTAEYSMIPRATNVRTQRESAKGKLSGRTMEIQRLVGRSLRSIVDLYKLGERSIIVDCDVIQADGGTRTASITGGFIAMKLAVNKLLKEGIIAEDPIKEYLAAISVGIHEENIILDLDYYEDSAAEVDMNVVLTESGKYVEIQGTGEESTFTEEQLHIMLNLAKKGIGELIAMQKQVLGDSNESNICCNEK